MEGVAMLRYLVLIGSTAMFLYQDCTKNKKIFYHPFYMQWRKQDSSYTKKILTE